MVCLSSTLAVVYHLPPATPIRTGCRSCRTWFRRVPITPPSEVAKYGLLEDRGTGLKSNVL